MQVPWDVIQEVPMAISGQRYLFVSATDWFLIFVKPKGRAPNSSMRDRFSEHAIP
jgi:hypothetical protein